MDLERVMEVWCPAGKRVGSGYLISDRLVLTAYHTVHGTVAGGTVEVQQLDAQGGDSWITAELCWPPSPVDTKRYPETDAALLRITDPTWRPPSSPLVQWGRVTGQERLRCQGLGFPDAVNRPDGRRDTMPLRGHIDPLHAMKSKLMTVQVDEGIVPKRLAHGSGWAGSSGTAVFCGRLLVGVVTVDRAIADTAEVLNAVPVSSLLGLPGFAETLEAHQIAPHLEDATAFRVRVGSEERAPTHNLPAPTSEVFVGRADALDQLDRNLTTGGQVVPQALHGLGGVGKTALALYYAHTRLHRYHLAWWIPSETRDDVLAGLAALAARVGLRSDNVQTTAESADQAIAWLQSHSGWLLILDNAEHPGDLRDLLGQLRHTGHILITTRYKDGWPATPLAVSVLPPNTAADLLGELTGLIDVASRDQLNALAADLGYLPLALEQAGAFIGQTGTSIADYRAALHDYPGDALDTPAQGADPERTIARIWTITLNALAQRDPLAVAILRRLAWYAPDGIPRGLLADLDERPLAVPRALGVLAAYSMITLTTDSVSVHRLVQAVARTPDTTHPEHAKEVTGEASEQAVKALDSATPVDSTNVDTWPHWRRLLPHVEALARVLPSTRDTTAAQLFSSAGLFAYEQGQSSQAIALTQRAVTDMERVLGPDHPQTLTARNNLASTYAMKGDTGRAIVLHQQTLAGRERVLGPDHPDTLGSRNNLAQNLMEAGYVDQAIQLHEQNLVDCERALGPRHPHSLVVRANLAGAHQAAGQSDRALALHEETYSHFVEVLGLNHLDTLTTRNNLAHAYQVAGRPDQAVPLHEQILADRERALGPTHPDTLVSRHNLTTAYAEVGDLDRATALSAELLADCEQALGPDHPQTLSCRSELARLYGEAGQPDRAIALYEQTLAVREQVLGPDHPDTLTTRNNLATIYAEEGDLDRGIALLAQTLAERERVFGPNHPDTLKNRNSLATAYSMNEDLDRAIPLYEQTLGDCERALGPDHPQTLDSRAELASAYGEAGHLDRAIALYEQTLAAREQVLGPDHPDTLTTRNDLASTYAEEGKLERTIALLKQNLAERERVFGPDHLDTLTNRNDLATAYLATGNPDRAIPLHEQTIAGSERTLGTDHPNTLTFRHNLAMAYAMSGDDARAIPVFKQTLVDFERILGSDHPYPQAIRASLSHYYRTRG
ncbi:tetratricopeptide repeat protein [Streptomyces sp. NPDC001982]|uniref:tetratricopeptide repeat protein n=1 Tax=Streptomyces sp. NPDC001982 TaxID=3154405 RepID=UPI00331F7B0C